MTKQRILIIDDDVKLTEMYALYLEESGYETFRASTGQTGFHLAKQHQPHLIICDYILPDLGGLTVIAMLRNLPGMKSLPIILVSAYELPDYKSLFAPLVCMEKPVLPSEMLWTVEDLLKEG